MAATMPSAGTAAPLTFEIAALLAGAIGIRLSAPRTPRALFFQKERAMKRYILLGLALLTGALLGGVVVQGLHAQAKPPVYVIAQIDVTNPAAYAKEYVPKAVAINKAAGVRYLSLGGKVTPIEGTPPKSRVVIQVWDSLEQALAARNTPAFKEARKIGEKYATFSAFAVEGTSQ
jgi:uncharacterized protein (DUF1330 family)